MRERGKDKQITHTTTHVTVVYMYTPSLDGVGVHVYREHNSPGSVGGCGCGAVEDGEL